MFMRMLVDAIDEFLKDRECSALFLEGSFLSLNKNFEMKKERSVLELVHWYVLNSIRIC